MTVRNTLRQCQGWDDVVDTVVEKSSFLVKNKQKYRAWLKTKDLHNGKPLFGAKVYAMCYNISLKLMTRRGDHFTVVAGKEGSGKSTLGIQIASIVSPSFSQKDILYEPGALFDRIGSAQPGDSIVVDEGVLFLYSRTAMGRENITTTTIFQLMRQQYLHVVVCIPNFKDLDTYVRNHRTDTLVQIHSRGLFRMITGKGVRIIAENYPRRVRNVLGVKIPTEYWFDNYHANRFPVINDLNIDTYLQGKKENFQEEIARAKYKIGLKRVKSGSEPAEFYTISTGDVEDVETNVLSENNA